MHAKNPSKALQALGWRVLGSLHLYTEKPLAKAPLPEETIGRGNW
jgi:hypothetical protein